MQDRDALDLRATPRRLAALRDAGVLDEEALARAFALSVATPSPEAWRRLLSRLLLVLGALLSVAGVVFFFAFNWAKLPAWSKLGLLQVSVVASALIALRPASGQLVRQVALLASALLVGPLLGVYGQTYQTGADPWGLFALWAALIVPWALVARTPALFLLEVVLADVAVGLWFGQVFAGASRELWGLLAVAGVNAAAWAGWELSAARGALWARGRWWPRLQVASSLSLLLVPSVLCIFGHDPDGASIAGMLAELLLILIGLLAFRRHDLFVVAAAMAAAMVLVTTAIGRGLFVGLEARDGGILLMGIVVMIEVVIAVTVLRRLGAHREEE